MAFEKLGDLQALGKLYFDLDARHERLEERRIKIAPEHNKRLEHILLTAIPRALAEDQKKQVHFKEYSRVINYVLKYLVEAETLIEGYEFLNSWRED